MEELIKATFSGKSCDKKLITNCAFFELHAKNLATLNIVIKAIKNVIISAHRKSISEGERNK